MIDNYLLNIIWYVYNEHHLKQFWLFQIHIISDNNAVEQANPSNSFESCRKSESEKRKVTTESATAVRPNTTLKTSALGCTPENVTTMKQEIQILFDFQEGPVVHNFYKCTSDHC